MKKILCAFFTFLIFITLTSLGTSNTLAVDCSKANFNHDTKVDINDAQLLTFHATTVPNPLPFDPAFDLNGDGKIDNADLELVYGCMTVVPSGAIVPSPLPASPVPSGFDPQNLLSQLVTKILPVILAIGGFLTVIFIVISGIQFVTSSGNPEAAAAARSRLIFALVGFVVIILAFAATQIIDKIFLGGTGVF